MSRQRQLRNNVRFEENNEMEQNDVERQRCATG